MINLRPIVTSPEKLSGAQLRQLYALFSQYYDGGCFDQFLADLKEKDYVLLLTDEQQSIKGFTTALKLSFNFSGKQCHAIFSGDTIIHHDYWGSQVLPLSWCRLAGAIKASSPDIPLYWFLIVKGHRTYRYLPAFAKSFFPNWRCPTPPHIQTLIDQLATSKFGNAYQKEKGILHFGYRKNRLNKQWADIPAHIRKKQDVKFFLDRNPNYHLGDELVCITELVDHNLKKFALHAFQDPLPC